MRESAWSRVGALMGLEKRRDGCSALAVALRTSTAALLVDARITLGVRALAGTPSGVLAAVTVLRPGTDLFLEGLAAVVGYVLSMVPQALDSRPHARWCAVQLKVLLTVGRTRVGTRANARLG